MSKAARERVRHYLESLKQHFSGLTYVTTTLALVSAEITLKLWVCLENTQVD